MAKIKGLDAKVDLHPDYGVPQRIYDIVPPSRIAGGVRRIAAALSPKATPTPRRIAEDFLKGVAAELRISVDPSHLRFDKVNRTILGRHVLFQQYHDGKPI